MVSRHVQQLHAQVRNRGEQMGVWRIFEPRPIVGTRKHADVPSHAGRMARVKIGGGVSEIGNLTRVA